MVVEDAKFGQPCPGGHGVQLRAPVSLKVPTKMYMNMYKYTNTCTCTFTMCMPRCECISYGNNVPGTQGNGNCSAEGHSDPAGHVVHVVDPFIL